LGDLPAQPNVERQLGGGPPVVLREEGKDAGTITRLRGVNLPAPAIDSAEEPTGEGMTGLLGESG